ncbi:dienelactone hydrolase family protein [Saccharomonospora glauca]|uniref:dienelactone hydrolase family protein n=1 Tax=Saccharomonospora glauca TaxID=40990 RepID=UPI0038CD5D2C
MTTGSPSSASASGRLRVNLCRHRCARSPRSFSELRARTHTSGALSGSCPVVASYGRRDLVYGRHAHRLVNELTEHDIDHDVKVYGEAGHSFLTRGHHPLGRLVFLPLRLGYHEDSAADAWIVFSGSSIGTYRQERRTRTQSQKALSSPPSGKGSRAGPVKLGVCSARRGDARFSVTSAQRGAVRHWLLGGVHPPRPHSSSFRPRICRRSTWPAAR